MDRVVANLDILLCSDLPVSTSYVAEMEHTSENGDSLARSYGVGWYANLRIG